MVSTSAAASPPATGSCHRALPLPLDRAIHGHADAGEATRYAVETTRPGLLLIETRAAGAGVVAPRVRFLGRVCRPEPSNVATAALHGRHVHHVDAGTHYLAIEPSSAGAGFVVDAWLVPVAPSPVAQNDDDPPREPLDEWDEILGGVCPWVTRPGLLSTLTCAPRLRLAESETATLASGSPRVLALRLAGHGRLVLESPALLLDRYGRPLAELAGGESVDLAAGRYFLRLGEPGDGDGPSPWTSVATRLHFVLD